MLFSAASVITQEPGPNVLISHTTPWARKTSKALQRGIRLVKLTVVFMWEWYLTAAGRSWGMTRGGQIERTVVQFLWRWWFSLYLCKEEILPIKFVTLAGQSLVLLCWNHEWMCQLPELSITVNMDPPPMPILCGFMREVHSSAAMAPSTAEPPCWRTSLEDVALD